MEGLEAWAATSSGVPVNSLRESENGADHTL